jgi:hypothetical protein
MENVQALWIGRRRGKGWEGKRQFLVKDSETIPRDAESALTVCALVIAKRINGTGRKETKKKGWGKGIANVAC